MKIRAILRQYQLIFVLFVVLAAMVSLPYTVQAQEATPVYLPVVIKGTSSGTTNATAFDLTISLYTDPGDRTVYEENIRYFADSVYEMSNGGHQIREVRIYPNRQFADRADIIWIENCWPNAHLSAYGRGGGFRIEMCDNFNGFSFLDTDDGRKEGGYTIGHEWGHYFYGLMDEYQGQGTDGSDPGNPLASDTPVQNSIMNQQFQAVQGDFNWLNFSTALNNNGLTSNAQGRVYGASAWDTLARPPAEDPADAGNQNVGGARLYYPELANFAPTAGNAPSLELPASQATARDQLQITWMNSSNTTKVANVASNTVTEGNFVRYILIEINSDSMNTNDKLFNVIDAVGELIDAAEIGDTIGIITFDGSVNVVQALTEIDSESTRTTILGNLDAITVGGTGAATGNAARQALTEITASSVPTDVNRAVYLISGGSVTTGENLALGVIPSYASENIELYTFGYGVDETTETKLQQAETTGGTYTFIDDSDPDDAFEELADALEEADQNLSPIVDVNVSTGVGTFSSLNLAWIIGSLPVTNTGAFSIPFEIDSTLGEVEVEVFFQGARTAMQAFTPGSTAEAITVLNAFSMTQPIAATSPVVPDCEQLDDGSDTDTVCTIILNDPAPGTWYLGGFAAATPVDFDYWIGGLAEDGGFTLDADIESEQGEDVDVGEEVILYTALANDQFKVTDVTINATIIDPSDVESVLAFVDDGTGVDDLAGDGIYTVSYTPAEAGEHEIFVTYDNNNLLAKFTETGNQFAADRDTGITKEADDPVLINEDFERFAEFEFYADTP